MDNKYAIIGVYSIVLGGLLLGLKYFEYKFFVKDLELEAYLGLIAVIFVVLGVWIGLKVVKQKEPIEKGERIDYKQFDLSRREFEVLELISEGLSNQQIADNLYVSLPTIKTHTSNLYRKLDVKRRTEAVARAKEMGIL